MGPQNKTPNKAPICGGECGHPQWVPKLSVFFRGRFWLLFLGPCSLDVAQPGFAWRGDRAMSHRLPYTPAKSMPAAEYVPIMVSLLV